MVSKGITAGHLTPHNMATSHVLVVYACSSVQNRTMGVVKRNVFGYVSFSIINPKATWSRLCAFQKRCQPLFGSPVGKAGDARSCRPDALPRILTAPIELHIYPSVSVKSWSAYVQQVFKLCCTHMMLTFSVNKPQLTPP